MSTFIEFKYKGIELISIQLDTNEEKEAFLDEHTIPKWLVDSSIDLYYYRLNSVHKRIKAVRRKRIWIDTNVENHNLYRLWITYVYSLFQWGHIKPDNQNGVVVHTM